VLRQWWLRRMAESPRPLEEKLTLFWHDHFATGYEDKLYQSHILYKQNELFRTYADKYEGLPRGIVHDSAMPGQLRLISIASGSVHCFCSAV
jgi:uncharacterized protein (DUF1800 family)